MHSDPSEPKSRPADDESMIGAAHGVPDIPGVLTPSPLADTYSALRLPMALNTATGASLTFSAERWKRKLVLPSEFNGLGLLPVVSGRVAVVAAGPMAFKLSSLICKGVLAWSVSMFISDPCRSGRNGVAPCAAANGAGTELLARIPLHTRCCKTVSPEASLFEALSFGLSFPASAWVADCSSRAPCFSSEPEYHSRKNLQTSVTCTFFHRNKNELFMV